MSLSPNGLFEILSSIGSSVRCQSSFSLASGCVALALKGCSDQTTAQKTSLGPDMLANLACTANLPFLWFSWKGVADSVTWPPAVTLSEIFRLSRKEGDLDW